MKNILSIIFNSSTAVAIIVITFVFVLYTSSEDTIYKINQKKAFKTAGAFTGLNGRFVGKIPVPSTGCVMGEIKGKRSVYKFKDKKLEQKILVIPVTGVDEHNIRISGYQFKVIGDDIPGYRSINSIKEKIKIMLEDRSVIVRGLKSGEYKDYGYDEEYVLKNMVSLHDLGNVSDLADECIVSSLFASKLINKTMEKGSEAGGSVKIRATTMLSAFETARRFDKYFYNINYKNKYENSDSYFIFRKKVYEKVINEYQQKNNFPEIDKHQKTYKDYLFKNTRGISSAGSSRKLIEGLSKRIVPEWFVHKQIYQKYNGAISISEGWLPVEGYLKVVDNFEKKGVIKFPDEITKEKFYAHYQELKDRNDGVTNVMLTKIYYETPWWEMKQEVRELFSIEKIIDASK